MLYEGEPIRELIMDRVPGAGLSDFLVYVMGAYTAFNIERATDRSSIDLPQPYPPDALFDPYIHDTMEDALCELCSRIRAEINARAFIATDVDIPTKSKVADEELRESGMTPSEQSIAFSAASNAVVFLFPYAGINTGVAAEAGTVPEFFDLRLTTNNSPCKPPERFRIFRESEVSSATIKEFEYDYCIKSYEYSTKDELCILIKQYLRAVKRMETKRQDFPLHSDPSSESSFTCSEDISE